MKQLGRVAWLVILIVDAGFIAWGAMAALAPEQLLGPRSSPILPAGYEGFTGGSWQALADTSPTVAEFITMLFRVYGAYCAAFGLLTVCIAAAAFRRGDAWAWWVLLAGNTIAFGSAMTYDWSVNAIGPFELSEYLGIVLIYGALAVTAPFVATARRARSMG